MSILGRGLESLIPKRDEAADETPPLDVLHHQVNLEEPVYRFLGGEPVAQTASAPVVATAADAAFSPGPREVVSRPQRTESIFWLDVAKIEPNPEQPRKVFQVEQLTSLADSIRAHGILQPLLVTKVEVETPRGMDAKYQLVAGERRWRAAKIAGLREVPAIIRTAAMPDRQKLELALIENVQREDLNPLERAEAFQKLMDEFGLGQKEVADRIGKSREVVANALRILKLPSDIQTAIGSNVISEGHARALLMLDHDADEQRRLFDEIRAVNLTVRDAELGARAASRSRTGTRRARTVSRLDPDSRALQRQLEEAFGTRVKLTKQGEHGRIVVEFYSDEELRGILDRIGRKEDGYI